MNWSYEYTRCRVQNTGYKDARGTQNLNGIKKIQSEMKDSLIEIKNKLQENNSRMYEARIKSMIWDIRKQNITNQNKNKKEESKKLRKV